MENYDDFFESFDVPDLSNISHPDQNPAPATTTTLPPPTDHKAQLSSDQSSLFSSYYSTDGTLEQLLERAMDVIPQDQPMTLESDGFRSVGRSKTDAEIACENYQREYSALPNNYAHSSSSGAIVNPSCGEPDFDPNMHPWDFEFLDFGDKRIIIENMLSAPLPSTAPPPVGQHPFGWISSGVDYQREYSALPNNYAHSSSSGAVVNPSCGEPQFDPEMHLSDFEFLNSEDKRIIIENMLTALLPSTAPPPVGQHPVGCISSGVNATYSTNNLPLAAASLPSPPLPFGPPNAPVDATDGGANSLTMRNTYWTRTQHDLFLVGMEIFGKGDWKNIANKVVITKSHTQVASHAQKFFMRQHLPKEKRKRTSIHDINTVNPLLLMAVCARLGLLPPRVPDQTQQCPPNFDNN